MSDGVQGAIIGAACTAIASWVTQWMANRHAANLAKQGERAKEKELIDAQWLKMIELTIQYPTLEKKAYISTYPECSGDANGKERYENYCIFVYNLLGRIFKYYDGDRKEIEARYHIKEILLSHCAWWNHDPENLEYDEKFRAYIQTILDEARKAGKLK